MEEEEEEEEEEAVPSIIQNKKKACWVIKCEVSRDEIRGFINYSTTSGVAVKPDRILACRHGKPTTLIQGRRSNEDTWYDLELEHDWAPFDLGFFKFVDTSLRFPFVKLSKNHSLKRGDILWLMGYDNITNKYGVPIPIRVCDQCIELPMNVFTRVPVYEPPPSHERNYRLWRDVGIEAPHKHPNIPLIISADWDATTVATTGGRSGGPVFREDGSLVGIHIGRGAAGGIVGVGGFNYAVHLSAIHPFLRECGLVRRSNWEYDCRASMRRLIRLGFGRHCRFLRLTKRHKYRN